MLQRCSVCHFQFVHCCQKTLPEEIKEEPISLKKQAVTTEPTEKANLTDKLKKKLYESEMESIASTAKALMEAVSHVTSEFISTSHSEHVRHEIKIEKYLGLAIT